MDIKVDLIKLKKIKDAFTSESVKELETIAKKKNPLGYEALGTAIGCLIDNKNDIEDKNKTLREQLKSFAR